MNLFIARDDSRGVRVELTLCRGFVIALSMSPKWWGFGLSRFPSGSRWNGRPILEFGPVDLIFP